MFSKVKIQLPLMVRTTNLVYTSSDLTLSDDVLAVELEVDVQLIFQMNPKLKAFLSKQMLQNTSTISISDQKQGSNRKKYTKA